VQPRVLRGIKDATVIPFDNVSKHVRADRPGGELLSFEVRTINTDHAGRQSMSIVNARFTRPVENPEGSAGKGDNRGPKAQREIHTEAMQEWRKTLR
jgi:hypothetical protein